MKSFITKIRHLFIPHENNNYKAKALHLDFLSVYLVIAIFLSFGYKKLGANNVLGFATDITVEKLFQLTNEQREKNNLPVLTYNEKLSSAAAKKAADMYKKDYWSHYAPDGATPWDFILGEGYQYEYAGENLAKNFLFSQGVIEAWMNSPTHKENILRKDYAEVGYAIVNGVLKGEETTLVVQMFGKPTNYTITKTKQTEPPTTSHQSPVTNTNVLAKESKTYFPAKKIAFDFNLIFFVGLLGILLLDLFFASKMDIIHIRSKNLPHLIFFTFIVLGLLILKKGSII